MRRKTGTTKRKSPATRKKTTRRRRVSGIGSIDAGGIMMDVLVIGAGAIAAKVGANMVRKQWPTASPLTIAVGQIGAGVILPMVWKSPTAKQVGYGLIAFGVESVAVNTGIISGIGIGATGDRMRVRVNGGMPNNIRAIAGGLNQLTSVAGSNRVNGVGNVVRTVQTELKDMI